MLKAVVVVVAVLTPSFLSGTHPDYHVQTGHKSATMIVVHVSRSIDDVGTGSLKSWRQTSFSQQDLPLSGVSDWL